MTFTLTIELGAMQTYGDLARAVSLVGHRLLTGLGRDETEPVALDGGRVRDTNGNSVGTWEVK